MKRTQTHCATAILSAVVLMLGGALANAQTSLDGLSDEELVEVGELLETIEGSEQSGDLKPALDAYDELCTLVPDDPYFSLGYGISLLNAGLIDDALLRFEVLVTSDIADVSEAAEGWLARAQDALLERNAEQARRADETTSEGLPAETFEVTTVDLPGDTNEAIDAAPEETADPTTDPVTNALVLQAASDASRAQSALPAYVGLGSAASLLAGGVFSYLAVSAQRSANDHSLTRDESLTYRETSLADARLANGSFFVAGITGVTAWLLWRHEHRRQPPELQ